MRGTVLEQKGCEHKRNVWCRNGAERVRAALSGADSKCSGNVLSTNVLQWISVAENCCGSA